MRPIRLAGISLLATFAFLPAPSRAEAQAAPAVQTGDRVRVVWRESWESLYSSQVRISHLDLVSLDQTQLVARRGDRLQIIPLSQVGKLEKRVGTRGATAPEMVIGSAAGFAAAFAGGALKAIIDPTVAGASAVIDDGLAAGVLIGAPLGALAAYLNSRARPIYDEIGFDDAYPVIVPTETGGVGFGLRLPSR